jgi:hypothetical protein
LPAPTPNPQRPWRERWRGFIRAGETAVAVGCVGVAVSVSGDMMIVVPLLIAAFVVSFISILVEPSLSRIGKTVSSLAVLFILLVVGLFVFLHFKKSPLDDRAASEVSKLYSNEESVPGYSIHSVINIHDVTEAGRKYIFDFESAEGAKIIFYISASDRFTFAVTDLHGESYPLEVAFGGGIPINEFIFLTCEVGIKGNLSFLRIFKNGNEVIRRDFAFPIDLGSRKFLPFSFGNPGIVPQKIEPYGKNPGGISYGSFDINQIAAFTTTITNSGMENLKKQMLDRYNISIR